jgi:hypothetical protein
MRTFPLLSRLALVLAALLPIAGCGDDPNAPAPGIEPQIVNDTDAFSYQITDLNGVSGTWDYTWENTGTYAKVTHASDAGSAGAATVTIRDGAGTQVYSGALATTGETVSSPVGVAGTWTIRVTYAVYSNTQVNFAVIKE